MKQAARDTRRNRSSVASNGSPKGAAPDAPGSVGSSLFANKKSLFVSLLLIIVVGIICYATTFYVPFVLDDEDSILYNPSLRDWTNLKAIWAFSPNRFVTYWTLAANFHFGKLGLAGYHAVNLGIHIFASILVYIFIRLLSLTPIFSAKSRSRGEGIPFAPYIALFSALLFVSHPIQIQAVTYIIQRTASLVALFYILAMVLYVQFRLSLIRRQSTGISDLPAYAWLAASLAATIVAMFSKQNALTLPIALILIECFFFIRNPAEIKRSLLWLCLVILTLPIIPMTMMTTQNLNVGEIGEIGQETESISRIHYLFTQFNVIRTYLRLLFLPIGQNLDHDYPVSTSLLEPATALSLLLLIAIFALAVFLFRRNRLASFGIFFFFLSLAVESSIIPIRDVIFEHRVYMPALGIFLAVVSLIFGGVSSSALPKSLPSLRSPRPNLKIALLSAAVVILSIATLARNYAWRSTLSIWHDAVTKSPNKPRPHLNLGSAWQERGRIDLAQRHYMRALELKPNYVEALANLGGILAGQGKTDEAIELSQAALRINPKFAVAHSNLGVAMSLKGKFTEANQHFQKATQFRPYYKTALFNWGYSLLLQKKPEEAIQRFQQVLSIDSNYPDAYLDLGNALMQLGRHDEAVRQYQMALKLRPDWPEAQSALDEALNSAAGNP